MERSKHDLVDKMHVDCNPALASVGSRSFFVQ
uniref:Uncharacterized protein n=1 Tax=Arundo donax TaxID=35708 RepID=A0A0A9ACK7_ARUDO